MPGLENRGLRRGGLGKHVLDGLDGKDSVERETVGPRPRDEGDPLPFDGGIDPMVVIRWKDVYQGLEDAIDRSRQAMDILNGLVVKHS